MSNVLSKMMKNPSLVSHKELAEAKLNTTKLHCECMLCKNNSWEKPTLFCEWASHWKSQFIACCCVIDLNHKCEQVIRNGAEIECVCPRCCKACFNANRSHKFKCKGWCDLKLKVFIPCVHFRGYCF